MAAHPAMLRRTLAAALSLASELDADDSIHRQQFRKVFPTGQLNHGHLKPGGPLDGELDQLAEGYWEKLENLEPITEPDARSGKPAAKGATSLPDPVFGTLCYEDEVWTGRVPSPLWDREVQLTVDASERGPTQRQRDAYLKHLENVEAIRPKLPGAFLKYYHEMLDPRDEPLDLEEILEALEPAGIYVSASGGVGLLYDSDWELEHGIGVRISGSRILRVGYQDECF